MGNFFHSILIKRGLDKPEPNRPLWTYNLSREEFDELKIALSEELKKVDFDVDRFLYPMDATLFYAEYWRQEYSGGAKPSKELIANYLDSSLSQDKAEKLYKIAIKGAERLNVKWIVVKYTLRFNALLTQGGIPLKALISDGVSFKKFERFIQMIVQNDIYSIDDLKDYPEVKEILSRSFSNDSVLESIFELFRADNSRFIKEFKENDPLSRLIRIKEDAQKSRRSKPNDHARVNWFLQSKNEDSARLYAELELPKKFNNHHLIEDEFVLTCQERTIGKYTKDLRGDFIYASFVKKSKFEILSGEELQIAFNGKPPVIQIHGNVPPRFDIPTLWEGEDMTFAFKPGNFTKQEKGSIIYNPNLYRVSGSTANTEEKTVTILDASFKRLSFTKEITLSSIGSEDTNDFNFFADRNEDYYCYFPTIQHPCIESSNYPLISKKSLNVFSSDPEIPRPQPGQVQIYIGRFGESEKTEINSLVRLPKGLLEYDVILNNGYRLSGLTYNIGETRINYLNQEAERGTIEIENPDAFDILLEENSFVKVDKAGVNKFGIVNKTSQDRPKNIKLKLKSSGQSRSCILSLKPPFIGFFLVDDKGKLVDENTPLILGKTMGFRILTPFDERSGIVFARLYNTRNRELQLYVELSSGRNDLYRLEQEASLLFGLTNVMQGLPEVKLEIGVQNSERFTAKKSYTFRKFNAQFSFLDSDDQEEPEHIFREKKNVYVVPFGCTSEFITPYKLKFNEETFKYSFTDEIPVHLTSFCLVVEDVAVASKPRRVDRILRKDSFIVKRIFLQKLINNNFESLDPVQFERIKQERELRITTIEEDLRDQSIIDGEAWGITSTYFSMAIQFDIPFHTFDHLTALAKKPKLCAKFMLREILMGRELNQLAKELVDFQYFLGIQFLWIPISFWVEIWEKSCQLFEEKGLESFIPKLGLQLGETLRAMYPAINSLPIVNWVLDEMNNGKQARPVQIGIYHLDTAIRELRQKIGGGALTELPDATTTPKINENNLDGFILRHEYRRLSPLLLSPYAVALSISGKDPEIWYDSQKAKRSVLYTEKRYPEWYYTALKLFLGIN